jgi:YD repeat-containing protein
MKAKTILALVAGMVLVACAFSFAATVTHEYDELNRIIRTTYPDGTVVEYTYDAKGNCLSVIKGNPASPPVPSVQLTAAPAYIQSGETATLTWTSSNATSCSIDQGIGTVDLSGSTTVSPAETTTYTITATGEGGTATASATVAIPPTVTITAYPETIQTGGSSTLTWSSAYADTCAIDQGIGAVNTSGSTTVSPAETTTYTITATGLGGTATDSVTITVISPPAPTVAITADPEVIYTGGTATLTWEAIDADTCEIQPVIGQVELTGYVDVSPTETTIYTITATGAGYRQYCRHRHLSVASDRITCRQPLERAKRQLSDAHVEFDQRNHV